VSRLAELLAGLSLATDMGVGVPPETSLRACLVATRLGARLGLAGERLGAVYYATLLRHIGCTAWAHEAAALVGDDHRLVHAYEGIDPTRPTEVARRTLRLGPRAAGRVLTQPGAPARLAEAQCAQAEALAGDLGFSAEVRTALGQVYERHDGRGVPARLKGDAISTLAALVQAAHLIEALHRTKGRATARDEIQRRRGRQLAPEVCDAALADSDTLWVCLESPGVAEQVLDAEPEPRPTLHPARLADVALGFARFVDLKTPHTLGHSPAVADAAATAAARAGWPPDEIERVRLAALLHDLGAVSVGNHIWSRPGPLSAAAWEQVRLHAYHTERILAWAPATAPLAAVAGAHHERLDGSGYHRGRRDGDIERAARLLQAVDAFVAMGEARPHRPAHTPEARQRLLADDARAGRLDGDAVALLLGLAAGGPWRRPPRATTLTAREAEVLGLLARGLTNKEIATALGIALRTVKHHVEHVYEKTGVTTRAAAALFAVRHDLVALDRSSDP
jgi:HD-GYP domain-containing protein (c-di-GMP phosphodiesterase class II)